MSFKNACTMLQREKTSWAASIRPAPGVRVPNTPRGVGFHRPTKRGSMTAQPLSSSRNLPSGASLLLGDICRSLGCMMMGRGEFWRSLSGPTASSRRSSSLLVLAQGNRLPATGLVGTSLAGHRRHSAPTPCMEWTTALLALSC